MDMPSTNGMHYRFQENDLTSAELGSLAEIAKTARLKMCIPDKHAKKLIMLRYVKRLSGGLVATNRGRVRLSLRRSEEHESPA